MAAASDPVVIVSAARTPLGRFMGDLSLFSAHKLGSHVIGAALERAKLSPERVDEVFLGCVLPAGQGQAPARQAARGANYVRTELMRAERREITHEPAKRGAGGGNDDDRIGSCSHDGCSSILGLWILLWLNDIHHTNI